MVDGAVWTGSGLELARAYWRDVVAPVLDRHCPDTPRAVARVGPGSEVLGLDDAMSRDHDWGLRLQVFVQEEDVDPVQAALAAHLPHRYAGWGTHLTVTGETTARLGVDVLTVTGFAHERLGFDPREAPSVPDWLSVSGQAALEVTSGVVFEDGAGALTRLREGLAWYPDDLWRYVVACDWQRLDHELPLMARAGDRGDELGSRLIAARLVEVATHLAFLLCREWEPYPKWRGALLAGLPLDGDLQTDLAQALVGTWQERNDALSSALTRLCQAQRATGLPWVSRPCVPFWDRPFLQVDRGLVPAILDGIQDEAVRALPVGLGAIDQRTTNVELLTRAARRQAAVRG